MWQKILDRAMIILLVIFIAPFAAFAILAWFNIVADLLGLPK